MDINTILKTMNGMAEKIEVFKIMFIDTMAERINKCFNKFDKIDDRLEALEKDVKHLIERCDDLVKVDNNIIECMDDLEAKLNKLDNICVEQYDVLEAKNYQIKSDLDEIKYYIICKDELINSGGNNE